jgi:enterochelin esterase-like enzyme
VTFLARSVDGRVPRIVSDVTGWGEHVDGTFNFSVGRMTRVGRTDWYSLQAKVAPGARIEYLVAYAPTDYRIDPHNPRQSAGTQFGGARASEFVTPDYVLPAEFADTPASPAGVTTDALVESRSLRGPCRLIVYTPAGYRDNGSYPVAVVLDGRSAQFSRVLDSLIARQAIEPIVTVFVTPTSRGDAAWSPAQIRGFVTDELPAWLASRYRVTSNAEQRAIIGISYGAKDALDAALSCGGGLKASRPSAGASGCQSYTFGRLSLLIPGRRIVRADIDAIASRRTHRLRVAVLAGRYDRANVATARGLRGALTAAGHTVNYTEVPEGHSAVTWTYTLRAVLVGLFGPAPATP